MSQKDLAQQSVTSDFDGDYQKRRVGKKFATTSGVGIDGETECAGAESNAHKLVRVVGEFSSLSTLESRGERRGQNERMKNSQFWAKTHALRNALTEGDRREREKADSYASFPVRLFCSFPSLSHRIPRTQLYSPTPFDLADACVHRTGIYECERVKERRVASDRRISAHPTNHILSQDRGVKQGSQ